MSADSPAHAAGMRTDLSASAGAMARGAARGAVGALAASALALAFQAIVRNIVDIETMGLFTVATTVVVLAQLPALFGLEAGAVRYVSLGAAARDERAARGSAQAALIAGLILSTIAAVALFWLAPAICARFDKPEATHLLQLASLALPLLCTSRVCAACVLGFGLTGRSSTITAAQNVTRLLVTVPLVLLISDVTALGLGFAIAGLAGTVFALWLLRSVAPRILEPARDRWDVRSLIGFSWPQTLSQSLYLATLWTDTLVLAHYGTTRQVGIYGLVVALLAPVSQLTVAVSQAFTPRIAGTHARRDSAGLAQMLQRVSYWNLAVALPILGSMIVLREPLLALFGSGYEAGAAALVILALGQLVLNAAGPLTAVINLWPPARDALRQRSRVRRELRALHHSRAALRHGRRGDLDAGRALQRDAAAGGPGGAAVPHPPVPRRSAAHAGRRRSGRARHGSPDVPAVALGAARGGGRWSRVPAGVCGGIALLGVRDETRELLQRASAPFFRRRSS